MFEMDLVGRMDRFPHHWTLLLPMAKRRKSNVGVSTLPPIHVYGKPTGGFRHTLLCNISGLLMDFTTFDPRSQIVHTLHQFNRLIELYSALQTAFRNSLSLLHKRSLPGSRITVSVPQNAH